MYFFEDYGPKRYQKKKKRKKPLILYVTHVKPH